MPSTYMGTSSGFWEHHQYQEVIGSKAELLSNQVITILVLEDPRGSEGPSVLGS